MEIMRVGRVGWVGVGVWHYGVGACTTRVNHERCGRDTHTTKRNRGTTPTACVLRAWHLLMI